MTKKDFETELEKINSMDMPEYPNPFNGIFDGILSEGLRDARQRLYEAKRDVYLAAYALQKARTQVLIAECDVLIENEKTKK